MPSTRAAPKRPADSEGETTSKQAKPDDDIEKFSVAKMASTITRQIIHTAKAPAAVGPYSQAVRVGDTIYLSGSIGFVPETMELAKGGVEAEAHQALKNIGEVLKAAGVGYGNVVKTTVLLKSIDDFARVNAIYTEYFTEKYPARAAYQVAALPKNALVEIEAIAVTGKIVDV
ncbi:hypothetical protein PFISCL1PPCAC_11912 [Pristionchus fissidentatus]|uniref:Uncharacterized protein n=1 Tax=Pristionchus fissidentatus TaxID=1538716 RepID=A0AAV5VM22_9BILA|nr:hypothetical protein PFISCL1PPCAC_11912 [Pristionchus fissidentatus]